MRKQGGTPIPKTAKMQKMVNALTLYPFLSFRSTEQVFMKGEDEMLKITISDTAMKEYPTAVKVIKACRTNRSDEILGIIECLVKQAGLDPGSKHSLSYLQSALLMGKLQVTMCDTTADPAPASRQTDTPHTEPEAQEESSRSPIDEIENVFGAYKPI